MKMLQFRRENCAVAAASCWPARAGGVLTSRSVPTATLLTREIDVLPSFLSACGYEPSIAALTDAAYPYADLVTHRYPLEQVHDAYDVVRENRDDVIQAVLDLAD
jgi:threonine dehydrogenase-like Zn-dependent dehydrogenase